jgi:hypothetical protein
MPISTATAIGGERVLHVVLADQRQAQVLERALAAPARPVISVTSKCPPAASSTQVDAAHVGLRRASRR